jgi:surface antigen
MSHRSSTFVGTVRLLLLMPLAVASTLVVGATKASAACTAPVDPNISVSPSEGPPGTVVTISGSSPAGTNILVEGLGSTAQTVSNGTYSAQLTAVTETADCYDITVTSSPPSGGMGTFSFARFTITEGAPSSAADLTPTAITFDSATPETGTNVHFDSGLQNLGDASTDVFNIKWFVDGQEVGAYGSHAGVAANTTVLDGNSQFEWTFTRPGTHAVTFAVDVDGHVAESDEANNSETVQVEIASPATPVDDYPYANAQTCPTNCEPDEWAFYKRECTSFVAWRMNHTNQVFFENNMTGPNGVVGHFGNAYEWKANALRIGYLFDSTPARGSIAWYDKNQNGAGGDGHVAYVHSVNADGSIVVEDYNLTNTHVYNTRTIAMTDSTWPSGFIHIRDL